MITVWFVGAALIHDLVLLPLYAAADRALITVTAGRTAWVNHIRVPAALSGLLLLVWFPLITGRVSERYASVSALSADGFAARWLLITAALFAGSAVLFAVRVGRRRPGAGSDGGGARVGAARLPQDGLSVPPSRFCPSGPAGGPLSGGPVAVSIRLHFRAVAQDEIRDDHTWLVAFMLEAWGNHADEYAAGVADSIDKVWDSVDTLYAAVASLTRTPTSPGRCRSTAVGPCRTAPASTPPSRP